MADLAPVPEPEPLASLFSQREFHPFVTTEMIDRGLHLKNSIDLTERMAEAWLAKLISDVGRIAA